MLLNIRVSYDWWLTKDYDIPRIYIYLGAAVFDINGMTTAHDVSHVHLEVKKEHVVETKRV